MNAGEFVIRDLLNWDESPLKRFVARLGFAPLINLVVKPAPDAARESRLLRDVVASGDRRAMLCRLFEEQSRRRDASANPANAEYAAEFLNYRVFNAIKLSSTYARVDLFTPQMVDLHMGLGYSNAQPYDIQSVAQLVGVMRKIAIATEGRVHPFVSFDPYRQAQQELWRSRGESVPWMAFDQVKRSIMDGGLIGVKLYPPMGFAAVNNSRYACGRQPFLGPHNTASDWAHFRRKWGSRLDAVLEALYGWCERKGVPILVHANSSMYGNVACAKPEHESPDEYLGSPRHWEPVLEAHRNLRLCFGHFGGFGDESPAAARWTATILELFNRFPNVYADLSHIEQILSEDGAEKLRAALDTLLRASPTATERLMYGSDWHMLARFDRDGLYQDVLERTLPPETRARVMGRNAAMFLGLHRGGDTLDRLLTFYECNGVPLPAWYKKLEGLLTRQ